VPRRTWSEEQIVAALVGFHERTGRWPTVGEWRSNHGAPSVALIARRLGSWRQALVLAGGESRKHSHCRHGHRLTEGNVVVRSDGERRCLTCARAQWRRDARNRRVRLVVAAEVRATGRLAPYAARVTALVERLTAQQLAQLDEDLDHEQRDALHHLARITLLRERVQARLAREQATAEDLLARRMTVAASSAAKVRAKNGGPRGAGYKPGRKFSLPNPPPPVGASRP
jgi:hypothetical protein